MVFVSIPFFSFVRMIYYPDRGWECAKWIPIAKGHFSLGKQIEEYFSFNAADFDRKPVKSTKEKQIFPLSLPGTRS